MERLFECLAKYAHGTFDWGQPFHQEPDRTLEHLPAFGLVCPIGGCAISFRTPLADTGLSASASATSERGGPNDTVGNRRPRGPGPPRGSEVIRMPRRPLSGIYTCDV
jgi:hypothetical protein